MKDITTIQIEKSTRQMLLDIGKKGETYNDIIKKVFKKVIEK